MCRHRYEDKGHRSYGDNIPAYAQDAYFPGDEPGIRCELTKEACGNPDDSTPMECAASSLTEWLCPACQKEECDFPLWKSSESGKFFCCECNEEWTETKLARAFTSLLIVLVQEKEDAEDARRQEQDEKDRLNKAVSKAREILEMAA